MIVTPENRALRLITQNDHAHFSAELLSLWVTDAMPQHPRRRDLLFAAREHDNGWRETDSAPFCDRSRGTPHDFMSLPLRERWEIWRRGPKRYIAQEPYATLLINRHAQVLHHEHRHKVEWIEIFKEWRMLETALIEELGVAEATLSADYRWIDLTDLLSLAACAHWTEPFNRYGYSGEVRNAELAVDPFPLAGATTFTIPCREIPNRRYTSDPDLATELARARWGEYRVRVIPSL